MEMEKDGCGLLEMFAHQKKVDELRQAYPPETRVELIWMDDPQAPPVGCRGTIKGVDDAGNILVRWDNGSGLNLLPGIGQFRKVNE